MAKKIFDILTEVGFDPMQAWYFIKACKRIDKKNKTDEDRAIFVINTLNDAIKVHLTGTEISEIAIIDIAKRFTHEGKPEITQQQIDEIRLRYPEIKKVKSEAEWFLIVEFLLSEIYNEDYEFIHAISAQEIEDAAKQLGIEELNDNIIREVKNIYYHCDVIDKERIKGKLLSTYIQSAIQYL